MGLETDKARRIYLNVALTAPDIEIAWWHGVQQVKQAFYAGQPPTTCSDTDFGHNRADVSRNYSHESGLWVFAKLR